MDDVRRSFDAIADLYARNFANELDEKPFDRELLDAFSERAHGPIADLGAGPGQIGAYLARKGHDVIACDFSVASLRQGQRIFPKLRFVAEDHVRLPFADRSLGAIVAFYTLIYSTAEHLHACLSEIHRVLRRGGLVLIAIHGENGSGHFTAYEDRAIDVTMIGRSSEDLSGAATRAGLSVLQVVSRESYPSEHQTQRIYLLARS
ncbi:MAG: class I SAM-dependent methyltransferase [Actinomycetota bacterium]